MGGLLVSPPRRVLQRQDHLQDWQVNPTFAKNQEYTWACVHVCFLVEIINKGRGEGYIKDWFCFCFVCLCVCYGEHSFIPYITFVIESQPKKVCMYVF